MELLDWVWIIVGVVLLVLGAASLLLGGAGLAVKVVLEIVKDTNAGGIALDEVKTDAGDIIAKVLKALAASPPYLLAILLGLVLIGLALLAFGVTFRLGEDICLSRIADACADAADSGNGGTETPASDPTPVPS